ncbi:quaternary ammonium compound efflux SMR transporter SugE [Gilvimarinus sp. SDUM040013]|uniref:Guanidinium exporter n=1 Tax=Gilvimarinus gilvus TaxID=3058038 RepID=A0ABU4S0Y3_9GAMM|nr:quaternary ammonium compound efflux SMR transporter SugE [Gilvimarinus sp. SDUM040013]MDO3387574.1 quaternary ammonium compound efflux SMR transporter SugE [Gilvimarinus sp. SDUM040013]MDX6850161.1 quaternary ammonium compound efflux SMR transporter SugE [Gilvimarinus sp. SDUM040013]
MSWIFLIFAGLLEIAWAIGLKYTEGFSKLWPSLITVLALMASLTLLALALRQLPLSTAYVIWSGIGALGTVIAGFILFGEHLGALRLGCIALILVGIIGLKLTS